MDETQTSSITTDLESTTIDIYPKWEASINQKLKSSAEKKMNSNTFKICRVPARCRRDKEAFYDPAFVSIGPYHRGKKELQPMEEHKWRYLNDFLSRNSDNTLRTYLEMLSRIEDEARECYFEHINLSSKEFVEMLLLDGCFIVEFLLQYDKANADKDEAEAEAKDKAEAKTEAEAKINEDFQYSARLLGIGWLTDQVWEDFVLLENQIPFFVVTSLYDLVIQHKHKISCSIDDKTNEVAKTVYIVQIAANFVKEVGQPFKNYRNHKITDRNIDHLLHLYYRQSAPQLQPRNRSVRFQVKKLLKWLNILRLISLFFSTFKRKGTKSEIITSIPCAATLAEAGVKFKKKVEVSSYTDVTFEDGVLEIPWVKIDDLKRSRLMNLVAYEQLQKPNKKPFSSYVRLMDCLIDAPRDVEILEKCGVMVSYLKSDKETSQFFNQLNDYVDPDDSLDSLYDKVEEFRRTEWHEWRAKLMRDYFRGLYCH